MEVTNSLTQHMTLGFFIVVIAISEFAELNIVQRPDDYSFMRMSRLVAAERLPNYQMKYPYMKNPYIINCSTHLEESSFLTSLIIL